MYIIKHREPETVKISYHIHVYIHVYEEIYLFLLRACQMSIHLLSKIPRTKHSTILNEDQSESQKTRKNM